MAIRSILTEENDVIAAYGFGSFFRTAEPKDIDILLVLANDCKDLGAIDAKLNKSFKSIALMAGLEVDLTILTELEHSQKPLREHDKLVELWIK